MKVSVFKKFTRVVGNLPINEVLDRIRNGYYSENVTYLRAILDQGNNDKYDEDKKKLDAFTPSAIFKGGRKEKYLSEYTGIMCVDFDFDTITPDKLQAFRNIIIALPFTYACFVSPSNRGLKVLVLTGSTLETHKTVYVQLQDYYQSKTGTEADKNCKDVTRLCFMSWDPDLYLNSQSSIFTSSGESKNQLLAKENYNVIKMEDNDDTRPFYTKVMACCIEATEKIISYKEGNRNNFIYQVACKCNRKGVPEILVQELLCAKYDLGKEEICATIKSAYTNNSAEFAKYAKHANSIAKKSKENDKYISAVEKAPLEDLKDSLKETPTIPDDIIPNLPEILKNGISTFTDKRERDVFLTGALVNLSGCFYNVSGIYDQEKVYLNLFCFIIAPAASGKGVLNFSKNLASKVHKKILESTKYETDRYQQELAQFNSDRKLKVTGSENQKPPDKPPSKVLFIPANSSYAKLIIHLKNNGGKGIICETEADTMVNALKKEWGSYSDLLRKAFHHETVSSSKKNDDEYIEIEETRLSVALSGTFNQVIGLITSSEDGLFSRFIFYLFKVDQVWRDVSPFQSNINRTTLLYQLSQQVLELAEFLDRKPTVVELTESQWILLNQTFTELLGEVVTFTGEDAASIVKRLGLITFRIAMILSCLRKAENGDLSETIICTDNDFNSALELSKVYLQHSLLLFNNLSKQKNTSFIEKSNNKRQFLEALPAEFKRIDAIELGKKYAMAERTVDLFLKELLDKYLTQPSYGVYKKK